TPQNPVIDNLTNYKILSSAGRGIQGFYPTNSQAVDKFWLGHSHIIIIIRVKNKQ
ncbi:hypothetical protein GIB67_020810, partial [Kingdonia uniflora]